MKIRRFVDALPKSLSSRVYRTNLQLRHPKLLDASDDYEFTDARLKFVHILECMNYLRVAGSGGVVPHVYFEFGCHSARTFSAAVNASNYLGMSDAQFYAFDSFEGLPETVQADDGFFESGTFFTTKEDFQKILQEKTGKRLDESHIVAGYYCDSLTKELQANMPKAGIIHIDVDLYSSTKEVLNFVAPLMTVGTVLLFDDWYCFPPGANQGERRALDEFCTANPDFEIEAWKAYSTFGKSFFVTKLP